MHPEKNFLQLFFAVDEVLTGGGSAPPEDPYEDEEEETLDEAIDKARFQAERDLFAGKRHISTSPIDGTGSNTLGISNTPSIPSNPSSVYGTVEGGFSQKSTLKSKVGLGEDQSWKDYIDNGGAIPAGFEETSLLLYAEEKREKLYERFEAGEISSEKYLYEAYGKDLMRKEDVRVDDIDWWFKRYDNGDYSDPTKNPQYLSEVLAKAAALHEESERAKTIKEGYFAFQAADGEEMSVKTFEEQFGWQFTDEVVAELGGWAKMMQKMKGEYLPGFSPFIDANGDGTIDDGDYYLHTDGRTYKIGSGCKIENRDAEGNPSGVRVGNSSQGVAILKGFGLGFAVDTFSGISDSIATLGALIVDLFDNSGEKLEHVKETQMKMRAWQNSRKIGSMSVWNDDYWTSGTNPDDKQEQWLTASRAVGSIAGMIVMAIATGGASAALEGSKATLIAGDTALKTASALSKTGKLTISAMRAAKVSGGVIAKVKVINGLQKSVGFVSKFFQFTNGTVVPKATTGSITAISKGLQVGKMWGRAAGAAAILTIRDIGDNVAAAALYNDMAPPEQRRTEEQIIGDAFSTAAINFAITTVLRQTWDDVGATQRLAGLTNGIVAKSTTGDVTKVGYNALIRAVNSGSKFNALTNTFLDTAEMALTITNNQFAQQKGFSKGDGAAWFETMKNYVTSPAGFLTMAYSTAATYNGGFGKTNTGAAQQAHARLAAETAGLVDAVRAGFNDKISVLQVDLDNLRIEQNKFLPGSQEYTTKTNEINDIKANIDTLVSFVKTDVTDLLDDPTKLVAKGSFTIGKDGFLSYDATKPGKIIFEGKGKKGASKVYAVKPEDGELALNLLPKSFTSVLTLYKLVDEGIAPNIVKEALDKKLEAATLRRYAELNANVALDLSVRAAAEAKFTRSLLDSNEGTKSVTAFQNTKEKATKFLKNLLFAGKKWGVVLDNNRMTQIIADFQANFDNPKLFLSTSNMSKTSELGYDKLRELSDRFKPLTSSEAVLDSLKGDTKALEEFSKISVAYIEKKKAELIESGMNAYDAFTLAKQNFAENVTFLVHEANKPEGGQLLGGPQDKDAEITTTLSFVEKVLKSLTLDDAQRPFDIVKADNKFVIVSRMETSAIVQQANHGRTTAILAEAFNLKNGDAAAKKTAMDRIIKAVAGTDPDYKVDSEERIKFIGLAAKEGFITARDLIALYNESGLTKESLDNSPNQEEALFISKVLGIETRLEEIVTIIVKRDATETEFEQKEKQKIITFAKELDELKTEERGYIIHDKPGAILSEELYKELKKTDFTVALPRSSKQVGPRQTRTKAEESAEALLTALDYPTYVADYERIEPDSKETLADLFQEHRASTEDAEAARKRLSVSRERKLEKIEAERKRLVSSVEKGWDDLNKAIREFRPFEAEEKLKAKLIEKNNWKEDEPQVSAQKDVADAKKRIEDVEKSIEQLQNNLKDKRKRIKGKLYDDIKKQIESYKDSLPALEKAEKKAKKNLEKLKGYNKILKEAEANGTLVEKSSYLDKSEQIIEIRLSQSERKALKNLNLTAPGSELNAKRILEGLVDKIKTFAGDETEKKDILTVVDLLRDHWSGSRDIRKLLLAEAVRGKKQKSTDFIPHKDGEDGYPNFRLIKFLNKCKFALGVKEETSGIIKTLKDKKAIASFQDGLKRAREIVKTEPLEITEEDQKLFATLAKQIKKFIDAGIDPFKTDKYFDGLTPEDFVSAKKIAEKSEEILEKAENELPTKKEISYLEEVVEDWEKIFNKDGKNKTYFGKQFVERVEEYLGSVENFYNGVYEKQVFLRKVKLIPGINEILTQSAVAARVENALNDPKTSFKKFKSELKTFLETDYKSKKQELAEALTSWRKITKDAIFAKPSSKLVVDLSAIKTFAEFTLKKKDEYSTTGTTPPVLSDRKAFAEQFGGSERAVYFAFVKLSKYLKSNAWKGSLVFDMNNKQERAAFMSFFKALGYDPYVMDEELSEITGIYYNPRSSEAFVFESKYDITEDIEPIKLDEISISEDFKPSLERLITDTALDTVIIDDDSSLRLDTLGTLITGTDFFSVTGPVEERTSGGVKEGKKASEKANYIPTIISNARAKSAEPDEVLLAVLSLREAVIATREYLSTTDRDTRQQIVVEDPDKRKQLEGLGYTFTSKGALDKTSMEKLDESKVLTAFFEKGLEAVLPINPKILFSKPKNIQGYGTNQVENPGSHAQQTYHNFLAGRLAVLDSQAALSVDDKSKYAPLTVLEKFKPSPKNKVSFKLDSLVDDIVKAANKNEGRLSVSDLTKVLGNDDYKDNFYAKVLSAQIEAMRELAKENKDSEYKFLAVDSLCKTLMDNINKTPQEILDLLKGTTLGAEKGKQKPWTEADVKLKLFSGTSPIKQRGGLSTVPVVTSETAKGLQLELSQEAFDNIKNSITLKIIERIKNASMSFVKKASDSISTAKKDLSLTEESTAKSILLRAYNSEDGKYYINIEDLAAISERTLEILCDKLKLSNQDKTFLEEKHSLLHKTIYGTSDDILREAMDEFKLSEEKEFEAIPSESRLPLSAANTLGPSRKTTMVAIGDDDNGAKEAMLERIYKQMYLDARRKEGVLTRAKIQSLNKISERNQLQASYQNKILSSALVENNGSRLIYNLDNSFQRARAIGGFDNVYSTLTSLGMSKEQAAAKAMEIIADIGSTVVSDQVYAVHLLDENGDTLSKAARTSSSRLDDMQDTLAEFARLATSNKTPARILIFDRQHSAESGRINVVFVNQKIKKQLLQAYADVLVFNKRNDESYTDTAARLVPQVRLINRIVDNVITALNLPPEYKGVFAGDPLQIAESFSDKSASALKERLIGYAMQLANSDPNAGNLSRKDFELGVNTMVKEIQNVLEEGLVPRLCPDDIKNKIESLRKEMVVDKGILDKYYAQKKGQKIAINKKDINDFVLASLLDVKDATFLSSAIRAVFCDPDQTTKNGKGLPSNTQQKSKAYQSFVDKTKDGNHIMDSEWVYKEAADGTRSEALSEVSIIFHDKNGIANDKKEYTIKFDISEFVKGWNQPGSENEVALKKYLSDMGKKLTDAGYTESQKNDYFRDMFSKKKTPIYFEAEGELVDCANISELDAELVKRLGTKHPIITWNGSMKGSDLDVIAEKGLNSFSKLLNEGHIDALVDLLRLVSPDTDIDVSKSDSLDALIAKLKIKVGGGFHTSAVDAKNLGKVLVELFGSPDNRKDPLTIKSQYERLISKIKSKLEEACPDFKSISTDSEKTDLIKQAVEHAVNSINLKIRDDETNKYLLDKYRDYAKKIIDFKPPTPETIRKATDTVNYLNTKKAHKAFSKTVKEIMDRSVSTNMLEVAEFFRDAENRRKGLHLYSAILTSDTSHNPKVMITKLKQLSKTLAAMYGKSFEAEDGSSTPVLNMRDTALAFKILLSKGDAEMDRFLKLLKANFKEARLSESFINEIPDNAEELRAAQPGDLKSYFTEVVNNKDETWVGKSARDLIKSDPEELIPRILLGGFSYRVNPILDLADKFKDIFGKADPDFRNWVLKTLANPFEVDGDFDSSNVNTYLSHNNKALVEMNKIIEANGVAKDRLYLPVINVEAGKYIEGIDGEEYIVDSSTMVISESYIKELLGQDYKEFYVQKNGELYLPVLRQPSVKPDSIFFVKTIVVEGKDRNVQMPKTFINGKMEGDFDGDHVCIYKPSPDLVKNHGEELAGFSNKGTNVISFLLKDRKIDLTNSVATEVMGEYAQRSITIFRNETKEFFKGLSGSEEQIAKAIKEKYDEHLESYTKKIGKRHPDYEQDKIEKMAKAFVDLYFCRKEDIGTDLNHKVLFYSTNYKGDNEDVQAFFENQQKRKILHDGNLRLASTPSTQHTGLAQEMVEMSFESQSLDDIRLWTKAISINEETENALREAIDEVATDKKKITEFAYAQGISEAEAEKILSSFETLMDYVYQEEEKANADSVDFLKKNGQKLYEYGEEDRRKMNALRALLTVQNKLAETIGKYPRVVYAESKTTQMLLAEIVSRINANKSIKDLTASAVEEHAIGRYRVFVPDAVTGGSSETSSIFYNKHGSAKPNKYLYVRKFEFDPAFKEYKNGDIILNPLKVNGKEIPADSTIVSINRYSVTVSTEYEELEPGSKLVSNTGAFKTEVTKPTKEDKEFYEALGDAPKDCLGTIIVHEGAKAEQWSEVSESKKVKGGTVYYVNMMLPGFESGEWKNPVDERNLDPNTLLLGTTSASGIAFLSGEALVMENGKVRVDPTLFQDLKNSERSLNKNAIPQNDATGLYQRLAIGTLVRLAEDMTPEDKLKYGNFIRNKDSLDKERGQRVIFGLLQKYFRDGKLNKMKLTPLEQELLSDAMFADVYGLSIDGIDPEKTRGISELFSKRSLPEKSAAASSFRVGEGATSSNELALHESGRIPERTFGRLDFLNRLSLADGRGIITDAQALLLAAAYSDRTSTSKVSPDTTATGNLVESSKAGYGGDPYQKAMSTGLEYNIGDYQKDDTAVADPKTSGQFKVLHNALYWETKEGELIYNSAAPAKMYQLYKYLASGEPLDNLHWIDPNSKTKVLSDFGAAYLRLGKDTNDEIRVIETETLPILGEKSELRLSELDKFEADNYKMPVAAKEYQKMKEEFEKTPLYRRIDKDKGGEIDTSEKDLLEKMSGVSSEILKINTEEKAEEDANKIFNTSLFIPAKMAYKIREFEDADYDDVAQKYTLGNYGLRFSATDAGAKAFGAFNELRDNTSLEIKNYINQYGEEVKNGLFNYEMQRNALSYHVKRSEEGVLGLNKYVSARAWLEDLEESRSKKIDATAIFDESMKRLGFSTEEKVVEYISSYEIKNAQIVNYGISIMRTLDLALNDINGLTGGVFNGSLLSVMRTRNVKKEKEKDENERRVTAIMKNLFTDKSARIVEKTKTFYKKDNLNFGKALKKFAGSGGYIDFMSNLDALATDIARTQSVARCATRLPKNNSAIVKMFNKSLEEYFETADVTAAEENKSHYTYRASMFEGINSRFNQEEINLKTTGDAFKDYKNAVSDLKAFIKNQGLDPGTNYESLSLDSEVRSDPLGKKAKAYNAYVSLQEIYISALSAFPKLRTELVEFMGKIKGSTSAELVDWWGRKIPKANEARTSWANDAQAVIDAVKDLAHTDKVDYDTALCVKALSGEIYLMDKNLADKLAEHVFTQKLPGPVMSVIQKSARWASKMLMSQPLKLIRRLLQFSTYDFTLLSTANPKTGLYVARARADISAYFQSKGTVTSESLKNYLHDQGFDYTEIKGYDPVQMERTADKSLLDRAYFDQANKAFSQQNLLMRYAFYMAQVDSFKKGKPYYGVMLKQKGLIDKLETDGKKAIAILDATIGGPKGFSELSKKLAQKGFVFTTFPLAVARWATEGAATAKAIITNSIEGATAGDKWRALGVPILAMGASYAIMYSLINLFCQQMGMDEEDAKELAEKQEFIDPINSILSDGVVSVSDNSVWSMQAIFDAGDVFADEDTTGLQKILAFIDDNVLSKFNPTIRSIGEVATGVDAYGGVYKKNDYSLLENAERKLLAYVIGAVGANAIVNENRKLDDSISNWDGLKRKLSAGIAAEFGNTKAYKADKRNYATCKYLAGSYLSNFYEENNAAFFGDASDRSGTSSLAKKLETAMLDGEHLSTLQKIVSDAADDGMGQKDIGRAIKSISLQGKLEKMQELGILEKFSGSIGADILAKIKEAILYEEGHFPYIDELLDYVEGEDSESIYSSLYTRDLAMPYQSYWKRNSDFVLPSSRKYTPYSKQTYRKSSQLDYDLFRDPYSNRSNGYTTNKYGKKIPTIQRLFVERLSKFTGKNNYTIADLIGNYYENYYNKYYKGELEAEYYDERRNAKPKSVDWRNQ